MQEIVFHIGTKETFGIIVSVCGTLISLAWIGSGKFSKLDSDLSNLREKFSSDLQTIKDRLMTIERYIFGAKNKN